MKSPQRLLSLALAAVVCCGLGSQVYGQGRNKQPKLPPAMFTGKLVGVRGNTLQVTANEQNYLVQVGPMSKVYVEGPADSSFLRKGLFINFTVQLDARGNAEKELSEISIFTPSEVARPAVQQEGAEENSFYVAGQLASLSRTGKLTVSVPRTKVSPRGQVTGQVAKDVQVMLAVHGPTAYRLARAGSEVEVAGKLARQASDKAAGLVLGEDLKITLPAAAEKPAAEAEKTVEADKPAEKKADP